MRRTGVEPALHRLKVCFPRPLEDRRIIGARSWSRTNTTFILSELTLPIGLCALIF